MDNFDLRKYLAENKLLKEEIMVDTTVMVDPNNTLMSNASDEEIDYIKTNITSVPKMPVEDFINIYDKYLNRFYDEADPLDLQIKALQIHIDKGALTREEAIEALAMLQGQDVEEFEDEFLAEGRLLKEEFVKGTPQYYVKYTTQDGEEVKSELMSKREAIYKERDLVDSGVNKSSVHKIQKNMDLNGKEYEIEYELDKDIEYRTDEEGKPIMENIQDEDLLASQAIDILDEFRVYAESEDLIQYLNKSMDYLERIPSNDDVYSAIQAVADGLNLYTGEEFDYEVDEMQSELERLIA